MNASVAISADGNTAVIGSPTDNGQNGSVSIFARTGITWSQQGGKLSPSDAQGLAHFGASVAISADGNTAVIGGSFDNMGRGAAWVFTRSTGLWTQQGPKLLGTGSVAIPGQGSAVAVSADGATIMVGGSGDNYSTGAVWVFVNAGFGWSQQGSKLVGTGGVSPFVSQGSALAISADGSTAIIGAKGDNKSTGAAWIFARTGGIWTQQGDKLVGTGAAAAANQSFAVSISSNGDTVLLGRPLDNGGAGAAWVFTRSNGIWAQQGDKLTGVGAEGTAHQGASAALSGDGNTAVFGGPNDNYLKGAAWVFKRSGGVWTQQGDKVTGTGNGGFQGSSLALTPDTCTLLVGGGADAWVFVGPAQQ